MTTLTISLPDKIAKRIDVAAQKHGFSTPAKFVTAILHKHLTQEELEFVPFKKKPLSQIRAAFERTGKYNKKFIDSVIKGLRENSSFYAKKNTKS